MASQPGRLIKRIRQVIILDQGSIQITDCKAEIRQINRGRRFEEAVLCSEHRPATMIMDILITASTSNKVEENIHPQPTYGPQEYSVLYFIRHMSRSIIVHDVLEAATLEHC